MTDTPDLHTLAAEAMCDAFDAMLDDDHRGIPPMQPAFAGTTTPPRPVEVPCSGCRLVADAVLAAVLPAHLAELADELRREAELMHAPVRAMYPESSSAYALVWDDVAEHVAELASVAPETAPRPRHDDETAPAVGREAAQAQRAAEGDTALGADQIPERVYLDAARAHVKALFSHRPQLSDATLTQSKRPGFRAAVAAAYRAGQAAAFAAVLHVLWNRAQELRQFLRTGEYGVEYVNGWEAAHDLIDARFAPDDPALDADATPADGQDGDGHG